MSFPVNSQAAHFPLFPQVMQPQTIPPSPNLMGFTPHPVIQSGATAQATGSTSSRKIKRQDRHRYEKITDSLLQERPELWHPKADQIAPTRLLTLLFNFSAPDEASLQKVLDLFPADGTEPSFFTITHFKGVLANYVLLINAQQKNICYDELFYFYYLLQALRAKKAISSTLIARELGDFCSMISNVIMPKLISCLVTKNSMEELCQVARYADLLDIPSEEAANEFRQMLYPHLYQEVRPALNSCYTGCWHSVQQTIRQFILILKDLQQNKTKSPYFSTLNEHLIKSYKPSDEYIFSQINSLLERLSLILVDLANGKEHHLPKYFHGVSNKFRPNSSSDIISASYFLEDVCAKEESGANYSGAFVSTVCEPLYCPPALALPAFIEWRLAKEVLNYFNATDTGCKAIYPEEKWIGFKKGIALAQYDINNKIAKYNLCAIAVKDSEAASQQLKIFHDNNIDIPIMDMTELSILIYLKRMYRLSIPLHYGTTRKFSQKDPAKRTRLTSLQQQPHQQLPSPPSVLSLHPSQVAHHLTCIAQQPSLTPALKEQLIGLLSHPSLLPEERYWLDSITKNPDPTITPEKRFTLNAIAIKLNLPARQQQQTIPPSVQQTAPAMPSTMPTPTPGSQPLPATSSSSAPLLSVTSMSTQPLAGATQQQVTVLQAQTKMEHFLYPYIDKGGGLKRGIESSPFYNSNNLNHLFIQHLATDPGLVTIENLNKNFRPNLCIGALTAGFCFNQKIFDLSKASMQTRGIYKILTREELKPASAERKAAIEAKRSKIYKARLELLAQTTQYFPDLSKDCPILKSTWINLNENGTNLSLLSQTGYQPELMFNSKLIQSLLFEITHRVLENCALPSNLWIKKGLETNHPLALRILFRLLAFNLITLGTLEIINEPKPLVPGYLQFLYDGDKKIMISHNSFDLCDPDGYNLRLVPNEPLIAKQIYESLSVPEKVACKAMLTKEKFIPNNILGNKKSQERVNLFIRHLDSIAKGIKKRYFYKNQFYFFQNLPNNVLLDSLRGRKKEDILKNFDSQELCILNLKK